MGNYITREFSVQGEQRLNVLWSLWCIDNAVIVCRDPNVIAKMTVQGWEDWAQVYNRLFGDNPVGKILE